MPAARKQQEFIKRAQELISQMTLEEKVFQTLHSAPSIEHLGIKAYNYWNEALHGVARAGVATVFPQAIALAASFDEELLWQVGDIISTEGRAKFNIQQKFGDTDIYKGLTFWAPNVNIFRDPRWGRGHETYGEDPYLTSRFGIRFVQGIQGDDDTYLKAAACAKHFAVHSGPEDIRHSFNALVSEQDLRETYLPAFKALVKEADVEAVMGAYNRTNGEPCCGSKKLLVDILRNEWQFKGHVTSDCWAIKDFHEFHMVTTNAVESVALAMNMGCDLNCGNIYVNLIKAVRDGLVEEAVLDRALERLFLTRMKLGFFDDQTKVKYHDIGYDQVDSVENKEFNLSVSKQSLVLLKNNGILPLNKKKIKSLGIIGPNADNRKTLIGNYEGTASEYITVLEGIKAVLDNNKAMSEDYLDDEVRVYYSEGCHLFKNKLSNLSTGNDRLSEVKAVCECSDVIIACMGLDPGLEGEEGDQGNEFASGDKQSLKLPGLQEEILKEIYASKKPAVLILLSGSALAIPWADENMDAIVQAFYPGAQGGRAIAELLFGEYSPEGKLPVTFYRTTEELPEFVDYSMKGRTYRYMKQEALYPFGFGLSYTNIEQYDVKLSKYEIEKHDEIKCHVKLRNNGDMAGAATVQVYIKHLGQTEINCQLKGLKKVHLRPSEEQEVEIILKDTAFGLYNEEGVLKLMSGEYEVYVGDNGPDERSIELTGKRPYSAKVICREESFLDE